jgi:hypothetical protein
MVQPRDNKSSPAGRSRAVMCEEGSVSDDLCRLSDSDG